MKLTHEARPGHLYVSIPLLLCVSLTLVGCLGTDCMLGFSEVRRPVAADV